MESLVGMGRRSQMAETVRKESVSDIKEKLEGALGIVSRFHIPVGRRGKPRNGKGGGEDQGSRKKRRCDVTRWSEMQK